MALGVPDFNVNAKDPGWGPGVFQNDLDRYKQGNSLRDYIMGEQQARQKYQDERQGAYNSEARSQAADLFKRQSQADQSAMANRRANGMPEPGFAGTIMPGGQQYSDLDMYRDNMRHSQQNGMGNMFGAYHPTYQTSQYQNQGNPYQPRATQLNNAPNNYLSQMVGR